MDVAVRAAGTSEQIKEGANGYFTSKGKKYKERRKT